VGVDLVGECWFIPPLTEYWLSKGRGRRKTLRKNQVHLKLLGIAWGRFHAGINFTGKTRGKRERGSISLRSRRYRHS